MIGSNSKVLRFPRSILFMGFIVVFAVVVFCHYSPVAMAMGGHGVSECTLFAGVSSVIPSKDNLMLYTLLLTFLVVATSAVRLQTIQAREKEILPKLSLWHFVKTSQDISKLYNPLLEALRKGILHPQIYSPVFITN